MSEQQTSEAVAKLIEAVISYISPNDLKDIAKCEETAVYACMNLGLSAQIEASKRLRASAIEVAESINKYQREDLLKAALRAVSI